MLISLIKPVCLYTALYKLLLSSKVPWDYIYFELNVLN